MSVPQSFTGPVASLPGQRGHLRAATVSLPADETLRPAKSVFPMFWPELCLSSQIGRPHGQPMELSLWGTMGCFSCLNRVPCGQERCLWSESAPRRELGRPCHTGTSRHTGNAQEQGPCLPLQTGAGSLAWHPERLGDGCPPGLTSPESPLHRSTWCSAG